MSKVLRAVYKIDWTEYERGWGQRPDGTSLHETKEAADSFIKDHWNKQPNGPAPDEYTAPGTPYLGEVDEKIFRKVRKKGHVWIF